MDLHFYPWYHIPTITCGLLALIAALSAWQRRPIPGAQPAFLLMLCVALWTGGCVMEQGSHSLVAKLFWVKVQYPGIAFISLCWFALVLEFTGYRAVMRGWVLAVFSAIPMAVMLLNWTNETHRLIYSRYWVENILGMPFLVVEHGWVFWVFIGYVYLLTTAALVMSLFAVLQMSALYRRQAMMLCAAQYSLSGEPQPAAPS